VVSIKDVHLKIDAHAGRGARGRKEFDDAGLRVMSAATWT